MEKIRRLPSPPRRPRPESLLIAEGRRALVQRALEQLPVHLREILLRCEVEEMSYREIAETLSIPLGTVMSRTFRARRARRRLLQNMLPGGAHGV
jgi:RNA polymerase sigma-70 factor, ECF subfamily